MVAGEERTRNRFSSQEKKSIGRSCLPFFMDSNYSLVAAFVMAGNDGSFSGRGREKVSAI